MQRIAFGLKTGNGPSKAALVLMIFDLSHSPWTRPEGTHFELTQGVDSKEQRRLGKLLGTDKAISAGFTRYKTHLLPLYRDEPSNKIILDGWVEIHGGLYL